MQENAGGGLKDLQSFHPAMAAVPNFMYEDDQEISAGCKAGWKFLDPRGRKTAFLVQLCLSQGAGVSIILPTLPRKPWYCFPTAKPEWMYAEATERESMRPTGTWFPRTELCLRDEGSGDRAESREGTRRLWFRRNDVGTQLQWVRRLHFSASECLKIDLHFRISQEH